MSRIGLSDTLLRSTVCAVLLFAVFAVPFPAFATTIFSDSFTSGAGTLASHTPSTAGTSWTLLLNNGTLLQSYTSTPGYVAPAGNAANSGSFYTADGTYSSADYQITADVVWAAGSGDYTRTLGLRVQDSNNMYVLRFTNNTMTMYKRVAGTWTSIGSASNYSYSDNTTSPYFITTISFSAEGSTLVGKVGGVTKLTVTDSSITGIGKAGIGIGYVNVSTDDVGVGIEMDNVIVETVTSDVTAPTITSVSSDKANGSYTVGEVIDIDVTFSEAVTSTGNVTVTLETGATDRTCTFTVSSSTTGTCNYTVQSGDTTSDLTVSSISGTIADASSNAMSNFVPTTNLAANKALVIDTTAPTVQSFSPLDEAVTVSATDNLVITFTEAVDVETGNVVVYKSSDNSIVETINITSGLVTGTGTNTITINPSTTLTEGVSYYVQIATTALDDTAGNSYAGVTDTTSWNFTVAGGGSATSQTTQPPPTPSLSIESVGSDEAMVKGIIKSGSVVVQSSGLEYREKGESAVTTQSFTNVSNSFMYRIRELSCDTAYEVRVFSKNAKATAYSSWNTFTTDKCEVEVSEQEVDDIALVDTSEDSESVIPSVIPTQTPIAIVRDLQVNDVGDDVKKLQNLLIQEGVGDKAKELSRVGATGFFGRYTQDALKEFQAEYSVSPVSGYFGTITRAKIKSLGTQGVWW